MLSSPWGYAGGLRAAKQATRTIPVVAVSMGDPVGGRARRKPWLLPVGMLPETPSWVRNSSQNRLQLLRDAVPGFSRLAAIWQPRCIRAKRTMQGFLKETEDLTAPQVGNRAATGASAFMPLSLKMAFFRR